jgi:hypothetical protein
MLSFRLPVTSILIIALGMSIAPSLPIAHAQTEAIPSSTPTPAGFWEKGEDPNDFLYPDESLETHFDKLSLKADVTIGGAEAPWSETYWPAYQGGIAARYLDRRVDAFNVARPGLAELKQMTSAQIKLFSPAEKFDILNGDYDFPFTQRVLKPYKPSLPNWTGICHGWVPAAINYPEPQPITLKNKDGIEIQFGSSDVKGLMSFYYAWEAAEFDELGNDHFKEENPVQVPFQYRQLGERCGTGLGLCKGRTLNPAAFHLALTNLVGKYHRSFVVNVDPTQQVWNQPAFGYLTQILDEKKMKPSMHTLDDGTRVSDGAVKKLMIYTSFSYVLEPYTGPRFNSHDDLGSNKVETTSKDLVYWLYLNKDGEIVGGDWSRGLFVKSNYKTDFIGFAWRASRVPFVGKFAVLNDLYKPKTRLNYEYAAEKNFTPSLNDTYFEVDFSKIPTFDWSKVGQSNF